MVNLHASVVVLGDAAVIIFGESGSGKSSLALELLREALREGIDASLVADDRVNVERRGDRLFASAPANLAGLIEVRGSGIHTIPHRSEAALSLSVELVGPDASERLSTCRTKPVADGLSLPVLLLPMGHIDGSVRAILSHLGLYFPLTGRKSAG